MVACGIHLGEVLAALLLYCASSGIIDFAEVSPSWVNNIQRMDNLDQVEREEAPLVQSRDTTVPEPTRSIILSWESWGIKKIE